MNLIDKLYTDINYKFYHEYGVDSYYDYLKEHQSLFNKFRNEVIKKYFFSKSENKYIIPIGEGTAKFSIDPKTSIPGRKFITILYPLFSYYKILNTGVTFDRNDDLPIHIRIIDNLEEPALSLVKALGDFIRDENSLSLYYSNYIELTLDFIGDESVTGLNYKESGTAIDKTDHLFQYIDEFVESRPNLELTDRHYSKFNDDSYVRRNTNLIGDPKEFADRGNLIIGDLLFSIPPSQIEYRGTKQSYTIPSMRTNGSPVSTRSMSGPGFVIDLYFTGSTAINDYLRPLVALYKRAPFTTLINSTVHSIVINNLRKDDIAEDYARIKTSPIPIVLKNINFQTAQGYPDTIQAQLEIGLVMPPNPLKGFQYFKNTTDAITACMYQSAKYSRSFTTLDVDFERGDLLIQDHNNNIFKVPVADENGFELTRYAHESAPFIKFYRAILQEYRINGADTVKSAAWPAYSSNEDIVLKTYRLKQEANIYNTYRETTRQLNRQLSTFDVIFSIIKETNTEEGNALNRLTQGSVSRLALKDIASANIKGLVTSMNTVISYLDSSAESIKSLYGKNIDGEKSDAVIPDLSLKYMTNFGEIKSLPDNKYVRAMANDFFYFTEALDKNGILPLMLKKQEGSITEEEEQQLQENIVSLPEDTRDRLENVLNRIKALAKLNESFFSQMPNSKYQMAKDRFTDEVTITFNNNSTDKDNNYYISSDLNSISYSYANNLVPKAFDGMSIPKYQHMGIGNASFSFVFRTNNEDTLTLFRELEDSASHFSNKAVDNPAFLNLADIEITSSSKGNRNLLNSLGIQKAVMHSLDISTITGHPGWYEIHISFIENNSTLRNVQRNRLITSSSVNSNEMNKALLSLINTESESIEIDSISALRVRDIIVNKQNLSYEYRDNKVVFNYTVDLNKDINNMESKIEKAMASYCQETANLLTRYVDYVRKKKERTNEIFHIESLYLPGSLYTLLSESFTRYGYAKVNTLLAYIGITNNDKPSDYYNKVDLFNPYSANIPDTSKVLNDNPIVFKVSDLDIEKVITRPKGKNDYLNLLRTGLLTYLEDIVTGLASNIDFLSFVENSSYFTDDTRYVWKQINNALKDSASNTYPDFLLPDIKIEQTNQHILHPGFYLFDKETDGNFLKNYEDSGGASTRLLIAVLGDVFNGSSIIKRYTDNPTDLGILYKRIGTSIKAIFKKSKEDGIHPNSIMRLPGFLINGDIPLNPDVDDEVILGRNFLKNMDVFTKQLKDFYNIKGDKKQNKVPDDVKFKQVIAKLMATVKMLQFNQALAEAYPDLQADILAKYLPDIYIKEGTGNNNREHTDEDVTKWELNIKNASSHWVNILDGTVNYKDATINKVNGAKKSESNPNVFSIHHKDMTAGIYKLAEETIRHLEYADRNDPTAFFELVGYNSLDSELKRAELKDSLIAKSRDDNSNHRIVSLFPTFKLFFIEEDASNWKFYDDVYSYDGVNSIDITDSKRSASQTASIQLSNVSGVLTRGISDIVNEQLSKDNMEISASDLKLTEGTPILIKLGYGADHRDLVTKFQGAVVSIQDGPVLSVTAQSWGAELLKPVSLDIGATSPIKNREAVLTYILADLAGLQHFGKFGLNSLYEKGGELDTATMRRLYKLGFFSNTISALLPAVNNIYNGDPDAFNSKIAPISNIFSMVNKAVKGSDEGSLTQFLNTPIFDNVHINTTDSSKPGFISDILGINIGSAFDWLAHEEPAWEQLWELALQLGDYIVRPVHYNDGMSMDHNIRQSLYIGPKRGYYKYRDSKKQSNPKLIDKLLKSGNSEMGKNLSDNIVESYISIVSDDLKESIIDHIINNHILIKDRTKAISKYTSYISSRRAINIRIDYDAVMLSMGEKGHTVLKNMYYNMLEYFKNIHFMDLPFYIFNIDIASFKSRITNTYIKNHEFFVDNREESLMDLPSNTFPEIPGYKQTFKEAAYAFFTDTGRHDLLKKGKLGELTESDESYKQFYNLARSDNYKQVVKHHTACNLTNLIRNDMIVDSNNMFNKVNVIFPKEPTLDMQAAVNKGKINQYSAQLSWQQDPNYLNIYNSYHKNIDPNWFLDMGTAWRFNRDVKDEDKDPNIKDYMPNYMLMANRLLKDTVKTMYSGYIHLTGSPNMDPWDVVHVVDGVNEITGPVEIEETVQHFSIENGYTTSIVPNAVTYHRDYDNMLDDAFLSLHTRTKIGRSLWDLASDTFAGAGLAAGPAALVGVLTTSALGGPVFWVGTALGAIVGVSDMITNNLKANMRLMQIGGGAGRIGIIPLMQAGKPLTAGMQGVLSDDVTATDLLYDTYNDVIHFNREFSDLTWVLGLTDKT